MKPNLRGRLAAVFVTAFLAATLAVFAPIAVLAASDPGCTALGGSDGAGTCDVSAPVTVTGTIVVGENLHLLAGAVLTVNPGPFTLQVNGNLEMDNTSKIDGSATTTNGDNITVIVSGDMTMHGGSTITSATTDFGGTAGTITIHIGNYPNIPPSGVFIMEPGSLVSANGGGSGTANDIVITAGKSAVINGQVLSQVLGGSTGTGAVQGRDGASIFISTGCGLDVGGTVSSYGRDPGADLVHLQSCAVSISGFVQSSGQGHAVPNNPTNHCAHTFRPGKPDNATGCVEVWADVITITNTGEIEADINEDGAGGASGSSWIDLFAWSRLDINGRTGPTDTFAVHADSYSGSDSTPNTVTAKVIAGTLTGGGKIFSASDPGNGSAGGAVVVEASGAVTLDTGTVMAAGDNVGGGIGSPPPCDGGSGACGMGGTIDVRSFNAAVSWQNGVGNVNPDNQPSANAGQISLTACTAITVTGTNFDDATPTQTTGTCGGAPTVANYVEFLHDVWTACRTEELPPEFCEKQPVQTVLDPQTGLYPGNAGPDVVVRVDLGQSVQDAVNNTGDANNDGYIIIGVSAHADGSLGGSANQKVAVWMNYGETKPFALIGCSVTLTGGGSDPAVWVKSSANAKNITVNGRTTDIFVMDLHGGSSAVGVQADGNYRYLRNEYGIGNGVGLKVVGNYNTIHNGKGEANTGDGVFVQGNSNKVTDTDSFSNGGNGFNVVGASNQLLKLDAGDKGKGNALDGVHVAGNSNTISENGAFANGGDGIDVAGNSNALSKNVAGDKGKGNTGHGIRVAGASNNLTENKASANGGDGFVVSGGLTSATANLLKNNQSNTGTENVGAEFRLTNYIKNNGGGNKVDGVQLPNTTKMPAGFPASGTTKNFAGATTAE